MELNSPDETARRRILELKLRSVRHGRGQRYAGAVSEPAESGPARLTEPGIAAPASAEPAEDSTFDSVLLARQHPELDWSDPDGALETLSILSDPEAMADLEEAERDIAAGNLLPMDRYASPG